MAAEIAATHSLRSEDFQGNSQVADTPAFCARGYCLRSIHSQQRRKCCCTAEGFPFLDIQSWGYGKVPNRPFAARKSDKQGAEQTLHTSQPRECPQMFENTCASFIVGVSFFWFSRALRCGKNGPTQYQWNRQ